MAMSISEAYKQLKSKTAALSNLKERAKEESAHVMRAGATGGVAFLLSAVDGYRGKRLEVGGVDGALLIGVGGHVAAFAIGGAESQYVHAAADGALAKSAVYYGEQFGKNMAEKKDDKKKDSTKGDTTGADNVRQLRERATTSYPSGSYQGALARM